MGTLFPFDDYIILLIYNKLWSLSPSISLSFYQTREKSLMPLHVNLKE